MSAFYSASLMPVPTCIDSPTLCTSQACSCASCIGMLCNCLSTPKHKLFVTVPAYTMQVECSRARHLGRK